MYFLAFAGGSRELSAEHQKNWDKTKSLPGLLQVKERRKLGLENDPGVIPLQGIHLIEFIKDLQFVPMFDRAFDFTHLLQLTDPIIYESIRQKNYDIALGGD